MISRIVMQVKRQKQDTEIKILVLSRINITFVPQSKG